MISIVVGRRLQRLLLGVLAVVALMWLAPAPAGAHATLISSTPVANSVVATSPSTATLTFNETVRPVAASFQLYDRSGVKQAVSAQAVDQVVRIDLPRGLAPGNYALGWRVISADAHPISGALTFAVGRAGGAAVGLPDDSSNLAVDRAYLAAQVAAYLGLMAAAGLTAFEVVVLRSTARHSRGRDRWLGRSVALTVLGSAALVPLTLIREEGSGLDRLLSTFTLRAGFSSGAGAAFGLVVLGCSAMLLRPILPGRRLANGVAIVGAAIALASVLPVGHTRTATPTWLVMSADLVHVAAGAVWFGGVIGLAVYLVEARKSGSHAVVAAAVVTRFSAVAGALVVLLGVTGVVLAVTILGSMPALFQTNYGRTLLAKLGLAVIIALLAVWNRYHLVPAVTKLSAPLPQWRRLRAAVRDEVALLVAVICVTALLGMQSPNVPAPGAGTPAVPSAPTAAVAFRSSLGAGSVEGSVRPALVGDNVVEFDLRDADGQVLKPLERPEMTATLPTAGLGPLPGTVERFGQQGHYRATIPLPVSGSWRLRISVRVSKFERPSAEATVDVRG